ncbi:LuxR C-terminal-related transcriptional regulator [Azospirillum sp. ST 5-10]|uniref:LuxR C-terminal-related transcriptional regulator n=1 Tax=unclassified Azospirillum TaxID=2630922 RepID=UPI003F4A76EA
MHGVQRFRIDAGRARAACQRSDGAGGAQRVLVVDDHGLVRRGLALAIRVSNAGCTVYEAGSLAQARRLVHSIPDLSAVLYDLHLGDADGVPGLKAMLEVAGGVPVIVVSGSLDAQTVGDCLRAGARGVLPKSCSADVLDHALPLVLGGGVYAPLGPRDVASAPPPRSAPSGRLSELTERQRAVLALLMEGQSNKEIARALGVLEGTVKVHLRAIMQKLRVRNRTQLALVAARSGARLDA